jgi:hypothetical protein
MIFDSSAAGPPRWRRCRALAALAVTAPFLSPLACSSDIFDVDVNLARENYQADFGAAAGAIPTVTCDPARPQDCGANAGPVQVPLGSGAAQAQLGCDPAAQRCFAQAHASVVYPVNILQDDDFVTKVERRSVVIVRSVDVAYTVPVNTLTFDVPEIQVYVGPPQSTTTTDPGVVPVGTTQPVAAGQILDDASAGHLIVADGSPARGFIETSILDKQMLVFILTLAPRIEAGAPLPAGALEVDLLPRLTLGLPR